MKEKLLLALVAALSWGNGAYSSDLEVTIRTHARQVVCGDPLYIEVTIVNRGKTVASAPAPHPDLNTLGFKIYDPETSLELRHGEGGGFVGAGDPVQYEPGKPITHFWTVYLPGLERFNHPFWTSIRRGQRVDIWGVYGLRSGLGLSSNRQDVYIEARDAEELRTLEDWSKVKVADWEKGPKVADFGLRLLAVNRQQTMEVAARMKAGEIQDLLKLTLQLQELYQAPPENREASNRLLGEWLQKQPEIKRQALTKRVLNIAKANNMTSTATTAAAVLSAERVETK